MPNRYQRRSRPVSLAPVIGLAILLGGLAYAQQNLPQPPPAAPAAPATPAVPTTDPAAAESTPAATPGPAATAATPQPNATPTDPAPPRPAAAKGSPQRFEPTEKVRADFDVAFPVDI
jgi:hypothetical protein